MAGIGGKIGGGGAVGGGGGSHEVVVTVGVDGELEVAVNGFQGKGCKALTEAIERDLGSVVSSKTTAEYNQLPPVVKQHQARR